MGKRCSDQAILCLMGGSRRRAQIRMVPASQDKVRKPQLWYSWLLSTLLPAPLSTLGFPPYCKRQSQNPTPSFHFFVAAPVSAGIVSAPSPECWFFALSNFLGLGTWPVQPTSGTFLRLVYMDSLQNFLLPASPLFREKT